MQRTLPLLGASSVNGPIFSEQHLIWKTILLLWSLVMVRSELHQAQSALAMELQSSLSTFLKRCTEVASEKDASTWLTVLPLKCHGFALHKVPSVMHYAYSMAGYHLICHYTVPVELNLQ